MSTFRLIFLVCLGCHCLVTSSSQKRTKRSLFNFSQMIRCGTGRSSFDFNVYGCYCGMGGIGEPVDNIDRCCQKHDECYRDARIRLHCRPKTDNYAWRCYKDHPTTMSSHTVECNNDVNDRCERAICACDARAVHCFRAHLHSYAADKPVCPTKKPLTARVVDELSSKLFPWIIFIVV